MVQLPGGGVFQDESTGAADPESTRPAEDKPRDEGAGVPESEGASGGGDGAEETRSHTWRVFGVMPRKCARGLWKGLSTGVYDLT